MFWASGHNNKCFVIPKWDMVIVRLGLDDKAKDDVWNGFLAKIGEASDSFNSASVLARQAKSVVTQAARTEAEVIV